MLILAFDTTSEVGGVGIFRDHECLAHIANDGPANRYSVSLFYLVDQAIKEAKERHGLPARGLADMELLTVAAGPGSFTGIRVGLAAAQGWAKAFGLPVLGVSVLEALVEAAQIRTEWAASILDAHRGEFFAELFYRPVEGAADCRPCYLPAGEGWLLKPQELGSFFASRVPEGARTTCVVRGHDRAALALRENLCSLSDWHAVSGTLVESVARLGLRNYRAGKQHAAGDLDALYIRRSDAETNWKG
jgi:tRNA threonylcarbamoyl adenosine modification protein YeaZ